MCGGIDYQGEKIYFPNPEARLPVRLRSGIVTWVTWGNRKKEANRNFPNGGWTRLDSIYAEKWETLASNTGIVADQFMEKDHDGQSHWISLDGLGRQFFMIPMSLNSPLGGNRGDFKT